MSKEKYLIEKIDAERQKLANTNHADPMNKTAISIFSEYFEEFYKDKQLSQEQKEKIIADYMNFLFSKEMKDAKWHFAVASALSMPLILKTQGNNELIRNKLAEDLSQMDKHERNFVLDLIQNTHPGVKEQLEPLIDPVKYAMLKTVKTYYKQATTLSGRQLENEVKLDPSQHYKQELQGLKGDALKTKILADFKEQMSRATSLEDLSKLKETPEYNILATRQGPNWLNYIPFLKTDSVKAFDTMMTEAATKLENTPRM